MLRVRSLVRDVPSDTGPTLGCSRLSMGPKREGEGKGADVRTTIRIKQNIGIGVSSPTTTNGENVGICTFSTLLKGSSAML